MSLESQNIEYKQSWHDEYLKWVCGFANAQGGRIYIGKDDNGVTVGNEDSTSQKTDTKTSQKTDTETSQKTPQKTNTKTNTKMRCKVLSIIKKNPNVTISELMVLCGLSRGGVRHHIDSLKADALIRRVDGNKGGHWEIIENKENS